MLSKLQFLLKLNQKQILYFLLLSLLTPFIFAATGWWIILYTVGLLWLLLLFTWIYKIGEVLHYKLPKEVKMPFQFFSFNMTYSTGYLIAMYILEIFDIVPKYDFVGYGLLAYAAFGVLYALFFISKSLVAIEENRNVDYFDYRITFYKFCSFFPFTALPIQKRVQDILDTNRESQDSID